MIQIIAECLWLFMPAGVANMFPVLVKWIPILNFPVDLGKKYKGKPIFGKNKTFRGLVFGIIIAIIAVYFQKKYHVEMTWVSVIDYSEINIYLLGFLMGFGALFGDLTESFFKRQAGIKSGKSWVPFDQTDWIIGAIAFSLFYIQIPPLYIVSSLLVYALVHPTVNVIGYILRIKKNIF